MHGPYSLTKKVIDSEVTQKSPGIYILAESWQSASLVGRSEDDLAAKLKWWANTKGKYNFFWYEYCDSVKSTFDKECYYFHTYPSLDNESHPQKPDGVNWQCPECKIFS